MPDSIPTTDEVWKPIPGWEELYEVSDHGRVRSLTRTVEYQAGHTVVRRGRILRPGRDTRSGHLRVVLQSRPLKRQMFVHQVVLLAFVGPCPPGLEGCHRDDDPANNLLANLRWDTRRNNAQDMVRNGGSLQGVKHHKAKLSEDEVHAIRHGHAAGAGCEHLAARYHISKSSIAQICRRQIWRHI